MARSTTSKSGFTRLSQKQMSEPISMYSSPRRSALKLLKSASSGSTTTSFSAAITSRKGKTFLSRSSPVILALKRRAQNTAPLPQPQPSSIALAPRRGGLCSR